MATRQSSALLRHLCRLTGHAALPDRELIERFTATRDEAAFAELVGRHGALVLGVCRRTLGGEQDAEDAFQAAFLFLSRKAGSIRKTESLASWLVGVAWRSAAKLRASLAERRRRERAVARSGDRATTRGDRATTTASQEPPDPSWREVQEMLHEELARLPEKYRAPLVACYLEGRTQCEAARQLGCGEGVLRGRLDRGRERLRQRLARRGITLSATLLAAAVCQGAPGSAALVQATVRLAAGSASPPISAIANAVCRGLLLARLKVAVLLVATVAGVSAFGYQLSAVGEWLGAEPARAADSPTAESRKAKADPHGDPLPPGAVARLGTVRFNHGDGLNALYFLPDGRTILSEGGGQICRWDAESGKELERSVTAKVSFEDRFSPTANPSFDDQTFLAVDGKTLLSLNQGWEEMLRVWDIGQRKEVRAVNIPLRRGLQSVNLRNAISPDGKICALNMEKEIRVHDVGSAKELCRLPFEQVNRRAATFAGPEILVTADKTQIVSVWQARTGKLVRQFKHGVPVEVLAASPEGRWLATLEHHTYAIDRFPDKDVIHMWDLDTGTEKHQLAARPKRWYTNMCFSPNGKCLLSCASGWGKRGITPELTVWDVDTGERLREISEAIGQVMAVNPDGRRLVCGLAYGKFELFDLKNGRRLSSGDEQDTETSSVVLSSDGARATTYGPSSGITWDTSTGRRVRSLELPGYGYIGPSPSPDGRFVVTNKMTEFEVDEIQVWDAVAGKPLRVGWHPAKKTPHYTCAFDPRSSMLACVLPGKSTKVHLVDLRTGEEIRSFAETKAGWPWRPFFTPDARTVFVAGQSKVAGYDVTSGKELFTWRMEPLPDNSGIGIAPVGGAAVEQERAAWRKLVVSPAGTVAAGILSGGFSRDPVPDRLFSCDARTGRVIRRWSDSGKPTNGYEELAFSADGRLLASSDFGHLIHLWEVATGKELRTFEGHRGEIRSLAFSADGRRLASSSTDSTVLVWDLVPALPNRKADEQMLAASWADLMGEDAVRAYAAVWRLAGARDAAVAHLRQQLCPVPQPDKVRIRQLIDDLDSDTFAVREKAQKELENLGEVALSALREVLEKRPSTEARRRVEKLLERQPDLLIPPETLCCLRALHALELIGSPAACDLLQQLAGGAPDARLTREATAALERLNRRGHE